MRFQFGGSTLPLNAEIHLPFHFAPRRLSERPRLADTNHSYMQKNEVERLMVGQSLPKKEGTHDDGLFKIAVNRLGSANFSRACPEMHFLNHKEHEATRRENTKLFNHN